MNELQLLKELGLSNNEARIYLALLQLKEAAISPIAQQAHIHRVTCYDVLEYLRSKELVVKLLKNKKLCYRANPPRFIQHWLKRKRHTLLQQEERISTLLPQLEYLFSTNVQKPNVYYYEGASGMKEILEDTIISNPQELLIYSAPHVFADYLDTRYLRNFARRKIQKRIQHKILVPKQSLSANTHYINTYYSAGRDLIDVKILSIAPVIKNEIQLYRNRMTILNYSTDNLFGVIIESTELCDMQTAIFRALWNTASRVRQPS